MVKSLMRNRLTHEVTSVRRLRIKQYLLAALFNAPATFDSFYRAEVRHDFDFRPSAN